MTKIFIVQANFYQDISSLLLEGALESLKHQNILKDKNNNNDNINLEIITVNGALEIPSAIAMIAHSYAKKHNLEIKDLQNIGFIALGCVIRGETTHYDIVCNESARGLNNLAIEYLLPIGNGIITVENQQQAIARASKWQKNKGGFTANACLQMIKTKQNLLLL